jgi:hypothetical protein
LDRIKAIRGASEEDLESRVLSTETKDLHYRDLWFDQAKGAYFFAMMPKPIARAFHLKVELNSTEEEDFTQGIKSICP